jgi:hypothetical protein
MHIVLHVKYPLLLLDFKESWIFSKDFRKILNIQIFMKMRPVGAELLHAVLRDRCE